MSWSDDANLGGAGILDAQSRVDDWVLDKLGLGDTWLGSLAKMNNTNVAADVYAEQVARDPKLSQSKVIESAAKAGASKKQLEEMAKDAGVKATEAGALSEAARRTVEQVGDKAGNALNSALRWLPWILGGAAVAAGAVAAIRLVPKRKSA